MLLRSERRKWLFRVAMIAPLLWNLGANVILELVSMELGKPNREDCFV